MSDPADSSRSSTHETGRRLRCRGSRRRLLGIAILAGALATGFHAWFNGTQPRISYAGLEPPVAQALRDLQGRMPIHSRLAMRLAPGVYRRYPRFFLAYDLKARAAMQALAFKFKPAATKPAIPVLIELLHNPDPETRGRALYVLDRLADPEVVADGFRRNPGPDDDAFLQNLAWWLGNPNGRGYVNKDWRWRFFERLGPDALPILANLTNALLSNGQGAGLEPAQAYDEGDLAIRVRAVGLLGNLGARAGPAVPALIGVLTNATADLSLRIAAAGALARIGTPREAVIEALRHATADERPQLRMRAAGALVRLDPAANEALSLLTNGLTHKLASVRRAAVEELASLGPLTGPATNALPACLTDPDARVREAATRAAKP